MQNGLAETHVFVSVWLVRAGRPGTKSSEYSKCTCQMPNLACKNWCMMYASLCSSAFCESCCACRSASSTKNMEEVEGCALTEWVKFTTRESQAAAPDAVKKARQKFILASQPVVCQANGNQVGLVGVVSWNLHWQRRHWMCLKNWSTFDFWLSIFFFACKKNLFAA